MADVAWGRASRADLERMLRFHPLKFRYSNRPPYVAAAGAKAIVAEMIAALAAPPTTPSRPAPKLLALFGHDTNVADLGGVFDLHWRVPSYPADDVPLGDALGFELVRDAGGGRYVRAFFRAQTMDQLRALAHLTGPDDAPRRYLPISGCGNSPAPTACPLPRFAPDHTCQAHCPHQPGNGTAGNVEPLAPQLPPDLTHTVDAEVGLEHAPHLDPEHGIAPRPRRQAQWILPLRDMRMVGPLGDRQHLADRLDPTSGENLLVVLLVIAPSSQEWGPPTNPARSTDAYFQ